MESSSVHLFPARSCHRRTAAPSRPINVTCDEMTAAAHSAYHSTAPNLGSVSFEESSIYLQEVYQILALVNFHLARDLEGDEVVFYSCLVGLSMVMMLVNTNFAPLPLYQVPESLSHA